MISIEANIKEVHKALHATMVKSPKIVKRMTRVVTSKGKTEAKKTVYSGSVNKRSGQLKKDYVSNLYKNEINPTGYIMVRNIYASNLEYGAVFRPKNKKYMTFQIDGQWVRLSQYEIKPQLNFHKTLESYFSTTKPLQEMEKVLRKELDKMWR